MMTFLKQNVLQRNCYGLLNAVDEMAKILADDPQCESVVCEVEGLSLYMKQGETKQRAIQRFDYLKRANLRPMFAIPKGRRFVAL